MIMNVMQFNLTLDPDSQNLLKMGDRCSTQLAKMNVDPKFVEFTADVVFYNTWYDMY